MYDGAMLGSWAALPKRIDMIEISMPDCRGEKGIHPSGDFKN